MSHLYWLHEAHLCRILPANYTMPLHMNKQTFSGASNPHGTLRNTAKGITPLLVSSLSRNIRKSSRIVSEPTRPISK